MDFNKLLEPGKIGTLELKNRFVVPPMGTNLADSDGYITDRIIEYYRRRAAGGFGLIIIEVSAVDPRGNAIINEIGIWDDRFIPGLTKLIDAIHKEGGKVIIQLHHAGRQTNPGNIHGLEPEAPSRIACPVDDYIPEEMSNERVWQVIDEYGDAAVRAKKCGADGVEVHGAHGYLIAQFMSTHSNRRMDDFGGDFEGRMKFPREIFRNIRKKVGADYPVTFRFGWDEKVHGGRTLEESVAVARMAEKEGVNALHVSVMTYASMQYMSASPEMPSGFNQFPTRIIKESVKIPVITVGRYNVYSAENALEIGCADFVSFGRESLADPEIPNKVKEGRVDEICPCISCTQSCLGYLFPGKSLSCLVNPVTGHELERPMERAENPRNVLVVGSGPAGLEAALVAAKKGHKVTVVEKERTFGGQFRLAAIPPTKHEIANALKYWHHNCEKLGVHFIFNKEADIAFVKEQNPDTIILATGAVPSHPAIKGIDGKNIVDAIDILDGKIQPGRNILMIGGGMTGVETADFLGEHNRHVTIIEMRPDIAMDEEMIPRAFLIPRLKDRPIDWICNATVNEFTGDGAVYTKDNEKHTLSGYDMIVLAMGVKPNNVLEEQLKSLGKQVIVIGDAKKTATANKATEAGLAAAFAIQ